MQIHKAIRRLLLLSTLFFGSTFSKAESTSLVSHLLNSAKQLQSPDMHANIFLFGKILTLGIGIGMGFRIAKNFLQTLCFAVAILVAIGAYNGIITYDNTIDQITSWRKSTFWFYGENFYNKTIQYIKNQTR